VALTLSPAKGLQPEGSGGLLSGAPCEDILGYEGLLNWHASTFNGTETDAAASMHIKLHDPSACLVSFMFRLSAS